MLRKALADAPSRRFFTAHAQSCLGSGLAHVALPLIAYENTRSAWAVTAVLIPDLMPAILMGPLFGALVDRIGWRVRDRVGPAADGRLHARRLRAHAAVAGARRRARRHGGRAVRAGRAVGRLA